MLSISNTLVMVYYFNASLFLGHYQKVKKMPKVWWLLFTGMTTFLTIIMAYKNIVPYLIIKFYL